ncbi:MAG: hypothetical protein EBU52_00810 [Cytophagia bacterium]|nr:hypothetical protein [Cytophagia bacterium]
MGVKIDSISFDSELTTGTTDYLLGNVLNSVTATVEIAIGWFAFATSGSKIQFAPTSGYPNPDEIIKCNSSLFTEFQLGDTIDVSGTASNDGSYTIVDKISANEIRVGTSLTTELSSTAEIVGTTPITALNYFYNLIENANAPSYISQIDGSVQKYFAFDLDATDTSTVVNFVGVGDKSWQSGSATIKGNGTDAYYQYFTITHNFLVIPYYVEGEYSDLIAGIKPYNFDNTNSLKYIAEFEGLYFKTDPNKKQTGAFVSNNGNVGWFDENFNTDLTNYSHTAIVHKTPTNITLPSVEISQNLNTFTFDVVNTTDSPFVLNTTPCILGFSLLSDEVDYTDATKTVEQNFFIDRITTMVSNDVPTAHGNYIENVNVEFINSSVVRVTGNFKFDASDVAYLSALSGKRYCMTFDVVDDALAIDVADRVTLLVDANELYIDTSNDGLIAFDTDIVEMQDDTEVGVATTEAFPTDAMVIRSIIAFDYEANTTFKTITAKIIAENNSGDSFDLDVFTFDLSTQPKVSDITQINISQARAFVPSGNSFMQNIIVKRRSDLDAGNLYYYEIDFPILFRWEYWKALLGVNAAFYNTSLPNNGYNNLWYRYDASPFNIKGYVSLDVINDGNALSFEDKITIDSFNYSSNSDWTTKTLKAYDLSNNELTDGTNKFVQGFAKTKIVAVFENTNPIDFPSVFVRFGAEVYESGGISGLHTIDSLYPVSASEWFENDANGGLIELVLSGNEITATAYLDNTKIPTGGTLTLYARIYNGTPADGKLTEAGLFKATEDGILKELE